jgi:tRNA(His) 5'-end guanylyltransferase
VVDYFRWRAEDAQRNALNGHCYWRLRQEGFSRRAAAGRLEGLDAAGKNELLFRYGINFNDLPAWQKRGIGLYWSLADKAGYNPQTGETVLARRRQLQVDLELPVKDAYDLFLLGLLAEGSSPPEACCA